MTMNKGTVAGLLWCYRFPFSLILLFSNSELRYHVKDFVL
jgi:hypothetical protein